MKRGRGRPSKASRAQVSARRQATTASSSTSDAESEQPSSAAAMGNRVNMAEEYDRLGPEKTGKMSFQVNEQVLLRGTGSSIYYATIQAIHFDKRQCDVLLDNEKVGTAEFSQIYHVSHTLMSKDAGRSCVVCHEKSTHAQNDIVVCDQCMYGYHQNCHKPAIFGRSKQETVTWVCIYCRTGKACPYVRTADNPFLPPRARRSSLAKSTGSANSEPTEEKRPGKVSGKRMSALVAVRKMQAQARLSAPLGDDEDGGEEDDNDDDDDEAEDVDTMSPGDEEFNGESSESQDDDSSPRPAPASRKRRRDSIVIYDSPCESTEVHESLGKRLRQPRIVLDQQRHSRTRLTEEYTAYQRSGIIQNASQESLTRNGGTSNTIKMEDSSMMTSAGVHRKQRATAQTDPAIAYFSDLSSSDEGGEPAFKQPSADDAAVVRTRNSRRSPSMQASAVSDPKSRSQDRKQSLDAYQTELGSTTKHPSESTHVRAARVEGQLEGTSHTGEKIIQPTGATSTNNTKPHSTTATATTPTLTSPRSSDSSPLKQPLSSPTVHSRGTGERNGVRKPGRSAACNGGKNDTVQLSEVRRKHREQWLRERQNNESAGQAAVEERVKEPVQDNPKPATIAEEKPLQNMETSASGSNNEDHGPANAKGKERHSAEHHWRSARSSVDPTATAGDSAQNATVLGKLPRPKLSKGGKYLHSFKKDLRNQNTDLNELLEYGIQNLASRRVHALPQSGTPKPPDIPANELTADANVGKLCTAFNFNYVSIASKLRLQYLRRNGAVAGQAKGVHARETQSATETSRNNQAHQQQQQQQQREQPQQKAAVLPTKARENTGKSTGTYHPQAYSEAQLAAQPTLQSQGARRRDYEQKKVGEGDGSLPKQVEVGDRVFLQVDGRFHPVRKQEDRQKGMPRPSRHPIHQPQQYQKQKPQNVPACIVIPDQAPEVQRPAEQAPRMIPQKAQPVAKPYVYLASSQQAIAGEHMPQEHHRHSHTAYQHRDPHTGRAAVRAVPSIPEDHGERHGSIPRGGQQYLDPASFPPPWNGEPLHVVRRLPNASNERRSSHPSSKKQPVANYIDPKLTSTAPPVIQPSSKRDRVVDSGYQYPTSTDGYKYQVQQAQEPYILPTDDKQRPKAEVVPPIKREDAARGSPPGDHPGRAAAPKYTGGSSTAHQEPGSQPSAADARHGNAATGNDSGICANCGKWAAFTCSTCNKVWYCSTECQRISWKKFCTTCHVKRKQTPVNTATR